MRRDRPSPPRRASILTYLAGIGVEILLAASLAGIAVLVVWGASLLLS